jgi:hypothetical protein
MKQNRKHAQKKGNRLAVSGKQVMRDEVPRTLPMLVDQLLTGFILRFQTTPSWSGSLTVTYQNLLDAWLIAGSATTAYQLFDFVKIRKVTIRAVGVGTTSTISIGPEASVGVEFPGLVGGQFGSGKQRIGNGMGYDQPAYVSLRPDALSQSAQFQPSTANAAFIVRAVDGLRQPIGAALIDVQVVYKNSADIAPAAIGTARAGMTPGQLYFGGLDGLALANTVARTVFIPQV